MTAPGASAQRGQPATHIIRPARKSCSQLGTSPGPADSTVPGPSRCCRTEAPRLPYAHVPSSTWREPRRDDHPRDVVWADCPHDHNMRFPHLRHIRIPFDQIHSSSGCEVESPHGGVLYAAWSPWSSVSPCSTCWLIGSHGSAAAACRLEIRLATANLAFHTLEGSSHPPLA